MKMTKFKKEENVTTQWGGEKVILEGPENWVEYLSAQRCSGFGLKEITMLRGGRRMWLQECKICWKHQGISNIGTRLEKGILQLFFY